jgi:hypothetical protein
MACHERAHTSRVEAAGIEPPQYSMENITIAHQSGAESGVLEAQNLVADPDLALIMARWPTLSADVRQRMIALLDHTAEVSE